MNTHNVIATIDYFSNKKRHISSEVDTTNSLCGKNLGFAYEVVTEDSFINTIPKDYSIEDLHKMSDMCKNCLKKLNYVLIIT